MEKKHIESMNIHGFRWFQRSYGNTYHSVEILINPGKDDEVRLVDCFRYGYGNHYLQTAYDLLVKNNYDVPVDYLDFVRKLITWDNDAPGWVDWDHSVEDVNRKRDLFI